MKKVIEGQRNHRGASQVALLLAFTLLVLLLPEAICAQWTTPDAQGNINSTNTNNIGIGTATPTAGKVEIRGDDGLAAGEHTLLYASRPDAAGKGGIKFGYLANGTAPSGGFLRGLANLPFFIGTTSTPQAITIADNGNVGFGNTTPSALLDLKVNTGDVISRFTNAGGAAGALDLRYKYESSQHRMGMTDANGNWLFYTQYAPSNTSSISYFPGSVGIGTATPTAGKVEIRGDDGLAAGEHTLLYASRPDAAGKGGIKFGYLANGTAPSGGFLRGLANLPFFIGTTSTPQAITIADNGNVGFGTSAPLSKLHVAGDITVDGNISAKYQDVAEWVPSAQKLDAGMVVILDTARDNHVTASSTPYDTRVAGVVSAKPGLSLGEAGEGKALVATTGRVKVKVDATRAPIKIGDLLVTSEVAGVAMRSQPLELGGVQLHRPGTLIGKALQSLDKGTGEILVLLSLQ